MRQPLSIFAPAKINLTLHITGRREDGYHTLDSLIAFTDIGDEIMLSEGQDFTFDIKGPYAGSFSDKEKDAGPHSGNLAVMAAWLTARHTGKMLDNISITLKKNLPLAAGLGGGTSNAAAVIWGLYKWWDLQPPDPLPDIFTKELGADLPACFACASLVASGIGETLQPVSLPEMPVVIINPGLSCPTRDVFMSREGAFSEARPWDDKFGRDQDAALEYIKAGRNDLTQAAIELHPVIQNMLYALENQDGCRLARMSGSGASCYGLFSNMDLAGKACDELMGENPDWWVRRGMLGRPERY